MNSWEASVHNCLAVVGCNQHSLPHRAVVGGVGVQFGDKSLFPFLSFPPPQIRIPELINAHISVSLFPSAAPVPTHPGLVAAGHWALWGTAERGGEYLLLGLWWRAEPFECPFTICVLLRTPNSSTRARGWCPRCSLDLCTITSFSRQSFCFSASGTHRKM